MMRQQLKEGPPEGSKGAGVGFIQMAREANGLLRGQPALAGIEIEEPTRFVFKVATVATDAVEPEPDEESA
jgi:hypothetical protein